MTIRLVVCDDHPLFLLGLSAALEGDTDLEIVGQATSAHDLLDLVQQTQPEVILTDLSLPDVEGAGVIGLLTQAAPDVPVIVLTMQSDDSWLRAALAAGARGYLLKGAGKEEIAAAVRSVAAGGSVYASAVAHRLTASFDHPVGGFDPFPDLTRREVDVLRGIVRGWGNHQIADHLGLADKTVRNVVASVLNKLGARDRVALAALGREHGMR